MSKMRRPFSYMNAHNHPAFPYARTPAYPPSYPMSPYASYPPYPVRSYAYGQTGQPLPVPVTPGANPGSPHYPVDPSQFNRKRQRRQAAGVVVQSLFSNNMGRKSTAQPRPVLNVPPRGIGPIVDPNENDVLSGRGGRINSHPGNVQFRDVIAAKKKDYLAPTTKKLEKAHIAASIVNDIRSMNPPGRFLKEDADTGLWWDIGDAKAIKKTGQALREDAPDIRPDIEGSSGEEDGKKSPKAAAKPKVPAAKKSPRPKKEPSSPKSPKTSTQPIATTQIPISQQNFQGMMAGPQHVPAAGGWQQQNQMMSQMDYQAQMAMPPPFAQQQMNAFNQQQQQQQQQQMPMQNSFQTRNIPIQAPMGQQFMQGMAGVPNQMYSGARSIGGRLASTSKHAMEVLGQTSGLPMRGNSGRMEDEAFGRTFHPPAVLSSDNTMSEISGLSDPLSGFSSLQSGTPGSALSGLSRGTAMSATKNNKGSMLSGLSADSGRSRSPRGARTGAGRESLRLSQVGRAGLLSSLGQMGSSRMSDLTASVRSIGSLSRSLSFPDVNTVIDNEAWQAIVEGDEEMLGNVDMDNSTVGGSVLSGRASLRSGRMSMMSLASETSSARWMTSMREMDDGKSYMSEMSSDLNALDLAGGSGF